MTDVITNRINLRGAAREAIRNRAPELLLAGPAGTGKSFLCLLKVHLMCLANPGMRALMVRKTHKSLTSTGLVTFREQVAKDAIAQGLLKWYGGSMEKPAQYSYTNGSVIVVGGMDNPDKVMSAEYDIAYVQEATDLVLDDWEKINSRLRNGVVSFQQLLADCNPQQPTHWLNKRSKDGRTVMLNSRHEDNPRLFEQHKNSDGGVSLVPTPYGAGYMARLDALTGVRKLRLRDGIWAAAEGLVYDGWRRDLHVIDRQTLASKHSGGNRLPLAWRRLWAIDFGFTNPFVWQQWAVDPDGRLILEHEIYQTQKLVEDHVTDILDVVTTRKVDQRGGFNGERTWLYPKPHAVICDHDAEDRATFERHSGLGTVAAVKTVSDGIQAVQARLKPAGDGRARLMVCADALVTEDRALTERGLPTSFVDEIEGYVWEFAADGKVDKDRPLKLHDHAQDAMRYVVAYEDLQGKPRVRWLG